MDGFETPVWPTGEFPVGADVSKGKILGNPGLIQPVDALEGSLTFSFIAGGNTLLKANNGFYLDPSAGSLRDAMNSEAFGSMPQGHAMIREAAMEIEWSDTAEEVQKLRSFIEQQHGVYGIQILGQGT